MLFQAPGTLAEADRLYAQGKLGQARELYKHLLATNSRDALLLAKLGACEYQLGDAEQALGHLRLALSIRPSLHPARLALGGALVDLHRPAEAIEHLERAVAEAPQDSESRRLLGRAYQEANRFFEGERTLTALVKQDPGDWESWASLGILLYNNNYYARALDALRTALKIRPANPRARLLEASSLAHLGKESEAARVYASLMADPKLSREPELLLGYTQFLVETGKSAEALDPIERAIAAAPNEAKLHFWRARVLMSQGQLNEAAKAARRAIELAPDQPNGRNLLLNVARRLNDKGEIAIQAKWLKEYNAQGKKARSQ